MAAVQFNLLPDIKLEYDKARKTKRLIFNLSFIVSALAVGIFVITFLLANVVQKKALSDADKDITKHNQQITNTPDLQKVLTVQNQLNALPQLHQNKHIMSRLFDYLPQITPINIGIGKLTLDSTQNSIIIDGTADKIETVNKFTDTLKFTKYSTDGQTKNPAFTSVILQNIGRSDKSVTYTVAVLYDPVLFQAGQNVKMTVPQELTTRSVTESPNIQLFNGQTGSSTKQGAQ